MTKSVTMNLYSKEDVAAMTQKLELGVECNVRYLLIWFSRIVVDDLSKLIRALINKPTLEELEIRLVKGISFENATSISNLLDPNINPLGRLSVLRLTESAVTDKHVVEICKQLENNKFLKELSFRENKIGDSGAKSLEKVLATNHSLERLRLCDNKIGGAGAEAIAEGIMQRQYPSHSNIARHFSTQPFREFALDLDGNRKISDLGVKAFASLLHKQHSALSPLISLTTLNLSWCSFGDEGAVAIAESLKGYHTSVGLEKLDLCQNGIGNTGAIAFANALKENKVLTYLNFVDNMIGFDGGIALCRTREAYNDTLHTIVLNRNPCEDEIWGENLTIGEYIDKGVAFRVKKRYCKAVVEKKRKFCQLVKANKIFKFVSYHDSDKSTEKV